MEAILDDEAEITDKAAAASTTTTITEEEAAAQKEEDDVAVESDQTLDRDAIGGDADED
jgi:hypothetical protein